MNVFIRLYIINFNFQNILKLEKNNNSLNTMKKILIFFLDFNIICKLIF